MNRDEDTPSGPAEPVHSLPERWILTRLSQVSEEMSAALDTFRFNDAASLCYQFVWHEFCDWYLEMAKQGLYSQDTALKQSTKSVLRKSLTAVLKLAHPFIPFVTEEIWQRLPESNGSIMVSKFPEAGEFPHDEPALREMDLVMEVITGVRNIRGEMGIPPSKKVSIVIEMPDGDNRDAIHRNLIHIQNLAKVDSVHAESRIPKPEMSATVVFGQNQVHVLLKGLLDFQEEKKRLTKEILKLQKEMKTTDTKLANKEFLEKAPEDIVEKVREKAEALKVKMEKLNQNLRFFESAHD